VFAWPFELEINEELACPCERARLGLLVRGVLNVVVDVVFDFVSNWRLRFSNNCGVDLFRHFILVAKTLRKVLTHCC
jgi:hypothetical protein